MRDMARIHDVGGMHGFGPLLPEEDEPPFHAVWEGRVYLLAVALMRRGLFTLDELRDAIERMPPAEYLAASYYERWLAAIERLLVEKGTLAEGELDAAVEGQRR